MAEHDTDTLPGLVSSLLHDTRDLVREEVALARAEIRAELQEIRAATLAFGVSAVIGLIGAVLLFFAIGAALAQLLAWPEWAGLGVTALLLLAATYVLVRYGQRKAKTVGALPRTRATLKENIAWMGGKSKPR
jgi:hypothetical protein